MKILTFSQTSQDIFIPYELHVRFDKHSKFVSVNTFHFGFALGLVCIPYRVYVFTLVISHLAVATQFKLLPSLFRTSF